MQKIATRIVLNLLLLSSVVASALDKSKFVENTKVIIFDIPETLVDIQNLKTVKHFGFWDSTRALFQGKLDPIFTKLLDQVPCPVAAPEVEKENTEVKGLGLGANGLKMPALQCNYLLGRMSGPACLKLANEWADKNPTKFSSEFQKDLFKKMVAFYFEPKTFYKYQKYSATMELMKKLYEVKTDDGKRKNIIVIISNQSKEQVEALNEIFPDIFKYSDVQLFSCYEAMLKQNPAMIEKALAFCPVASKYVGFVIDNDKVKDMTLKARAHNKEFRFEKLTPKKAEEVLASYGVMTTHANF